jgi:hypothetical protein
LAQVKKSADISRRGAKPQSAEFTKEIIAERCCSSFLNLAPLRPGGGAVEFFAQTVQGRV